eukprot:403367870
MKHEWDYAQGGKTSVKIHNAPGGNSSFSIGWNGDQDTNQRSYQNKVNDYQSSYQKNSYDGYYGQVPSENVGFAGAPTKTIDNKQKLKGGMNSQYDRQPDNQYDRQSPQKHYPGATDDKPSVRMHAPPGGKSSFSIGNQFQEEYQQPAFKQQDMNKNRGGYGGNQGYEAQNQAQPRGKYQNDQFKSSNDIFGTDNSSSYNNNQAFGAKKGKQSYGNYDNYDDNSNQQYGRGNQSNKYDQNYGGGYQQKQTGGDPVFGQRVESGSNSGPTTDKSSVRMHAPPGGKSTLQLF